MPGISVEEVRAQVQTFWRVYCGKSRTEFEQLYFPDGTILEIDARRVEPARLMVARRMRELFSETSSVTAELGPVDVQIIEPGIAAACYGFHFHVVRIMANGKRMVSDMQVARATHVFQRDEKGNLRIVHEHMSAGTVSPPREMADGPQS